MACSLCGGHESRLLYAVRGHRIVRCRCGFAYADVDTSTIDFDELYQGRYPLEAFLAQEPQKRHKSQRELAILERLTAGRRLLDVGSSLGFFLDTAQRRGWSVAGVELSGASAAYSRETYGLQVHSAALASAPFAPATFDVVTIRHVLEHVPDPAQLLQDALTFVRPGGLVLVAVPNFASLAARLLGARWWWVDPPTHLSYFTRPTLERLLRTSGVEPVEHQTVRGDDETLWLYLIFELNARIRLGRRRSNDAPRTVPTTFDSEGATPRERSAHLWDISRRAGNFMEALTLPVWTLIDRLGHGSELLVISQKPARVGPGRAIDRLSDEAPSSEAFDGEALNGENSEAHRLDGRAVGSDDPRVEVPCGACRTA